jgi:hypothetical protein
LSSQLLFLKEKYDGGQLPLSLQQLAGQHRLVALLPHFGVGLDTYEHWQFVL